jgi:catechol 2,3-dioxygenase-like lactoylglutathione lyase family enzyme
MKKVVPILKSSDLRRSLRFYTEVLDFTLSCPEASPEDGLLELASDGAELQLSHEGHFATPVNIFLQTADEVDALFAKYISRGLDISGKKESPVHQGPLDQTWGNREFYVNDPDGNTLRFCAPLA